MSSFRDRANKFMEPQQQSSFADRANRYMAAEPPPEPEEEGPLPVDQTVLDSIVAGAGQGATLGFADEIAAGLGAIWHEQKGRKEPLPAAEKILKFAEAAGLTPADAQKKLNELGESKPDFWERYQKQLDYSRKLDKAAKEANPWTYFGGEMAGGLLLPAGVLARGATGAGKVMKTAAEGALVGGAYGFGSGEGMENRLNQAIIGTVLGGAAGPAMMGAGRLISKAAGKTKEFAATAAENHIMKAVNRLDLDEAVEQELRKGPNPIVETMKQVARDDYKSLRTPEKMLDKVDYDALYQRLPKNLQKLATDSVRAGHFPSIRSALRELTKAELQDRTSRFLKFAKIRGAASLDKLRREGAEGIEQEMDNWYRVELGRKAAMKQLATGKDLPANTALTKAFLFMSDGAPAFQFIDNVLGTSLSDSMARMSQRIEKSAYLVDDLADELTKLKNEGKVTSSILEPPTPEMQDYYKKLREVFTDPAMGMRIDDWGETYVPKVFGSDKYLVREMNRWAREILEEVGGEQGLVSLTNKQLRDKIKNSKVEFGEYLRGFRMLGGELHKDITGRQLFNNMIKWYRDPTRMQIATRSKARGALERKKKGGIPDRLLEQDPTRATLSYISNMVKHASHREGLKDIRYVQEMAEAAGQKVIVKHLDNLTKDIVGVRQGTLAAASSRLMDQFSRYMVNRAEEVGPDSISGNFYTAAADIPDILRVMNSFVYPSLIGLNPRTSIQNLVSPYYMNLPELGMKYGSTVAAEGLAGALKYRATGNKWKDLARAQGYTGPEWKGEYQDIMSDSLLQGSLYKLPKAAIRKWSDVSMYMFKKSEELARAVNHFMAERVSKDLLRMREGIKGFRSEAARRFLDDIPDRAFRRRINRAVKEGSEEDIQLAVQTYLNARSMFNYNRANMSEFGRTMGPVFSVFTKWPMTMVGRTAQQLMDEGKVNGSGRLARMFMYPLIAAGAMDAMLPDMEKNPAVQVLVNKSGFKGSTPIYNMIGFAEGKWLIPPGIQATGDMAGAIRMAAEGEWEKAAKILDDGTKMYVPGRNMLDFLSEDIPQFITNKEQGR